MRPLKTLRHAALLLVLAQGIGCAQAENAVSVNDEVSGYLRDYLSDPRRVGSLSGSIMGGALTAHPVGPIIGSLIGFFIGKQAMFNEDTARARQQQAMVAQRDIVPADISPASLVPADISSVPVVPIDTQVSVSAPVAPPAALTRAQVASICAGGMRTADPRIRGLCYYAQNN